MSIFGTIMSKIFHHDSASAAPGGEAAAGTAAGGTAAGGAAAGTGSAGQASTDPFGAGATAPAAGGGGAPAAAVDVEKVLTTMASTKGGGGNYRTSIVDLLKLLDMDSSLDARKTLASELNVHAGADGSAEENIALHKAVMAKLAENGGTVPASLRG